MRKDERISKECNPDWLLLTGKAYELHHLGQEVDSPLAILTRKEHREGDNHKLWHLFEKGSEVHIDDSAWNTQRKHFWKDFARLVG